MYVSHETLLWWRVRGEISKSAKLLWPKKWEGTECRNCCGNLSPGSFPSHIPLLTVSFYITSVTHTQTNIDTHTEKITHTDVFGNQQIYHSTTFSNTISEWSELNPTRTAARNNTKDCLLTGQEQAWTRITRLFFCSFGCHHAENGPIHNPQYEEIFKKLEKSVDKEISNTIPSYSTKSMFENNPYENFQTEDLFQKSFENNNNVPTNLTPNFFDERKHFNHNPDNSGKLQRNYQRVVASASEVIEHVIDESGESKPKRRVKIRKGPKRRKKSRNWYIINYSN